MRLSAVLAEINRLEITYEVEGGQIILNDKEEAATPELLAGVGAHKPVLIALKTTAATWPPRPKELARWPILKRTAWGHLSNKIEDSGVSFPDCERIAFSVVSVSDCDWNLDQEKQRDRLQ